jgi:polar amino acid transport system substrate-binding protein
MSTPNSAEILERGGLKRPGSLVFCVDIGYPPMEFYADGQPAGADVEIAGEIARRLGREAEFVDEPVATIIDALYEHHSDLIINAFTDNEMRRRRLTFVDYLSVGQTVVLPRGNPLGIRSPENLAGRRIAVQADTSNESSLRELDAANQANGLAPMSIAAFKGPTGASTERAAQALRRGEIDADFLDVISAAWNAKHDGLVEVADFVVNEEPYGIGMRKDDHELQHAVHAAVHEIYTDGTISRILERWGLSELAFNDPRHVCIRA